jgi:predicted oxidoreductase (fatty acid repression mutant protein)
LNCSARTSSTGPETKHSKYWKWTKRNLKEILEVEHMTERKIVKLNNRNATYTLTFRSHFNK